MSRPRPVNLSPKVRTAVAMLLVCLATAIVFAPVHALAQGVSQRLVEGRVLDQNNQVLPEAIVYLQNQKTLEIKTYITPADGTYRFGQLSSDADYQLWAELKGHKSKTRAISAFDNKRQFTIELRIDTAK